jgi:hypothetical protein
MERRRGGIGIREHRAGDVDRRHLKNARRRISAAGA